MYHIIYLTRNLVNNKIYIGKKCSLLNLNTKYLGSGNEIKDAIKKYGAENFERIILYYCLSKEHAAEMEAMIVDEWFVKRKDTYNIKPGGLGGSVKGRKHSEETKMKISKSTKGVKKPKCFGEKISKIQIGRKFSEETRKKISESRKGKSTTKGRKHSEESKQKISEANKGKKMPPRSDEYKEKMSKTKKGYKHTEESKNKMKESAKKRPNKKRED